MNIKARIIPCLQLVDESLVKSVKFKEYGYIGDPINTVRIFNELEVDELCFLDIRASLENRIPNIKILQEIADECFMPLSYGGGIKDFNTAREILSIGFEKLVVNTYAVENPSFITELASHFGSQSVIVSIDVKKRILGNYTVYSNDGKKKTELELIGWIKRVEDLGAGEILLTSMDRDGTWEGYDFELIKSICELASVPVIANGGAGNIEHIEKVIKYSKASAVALGSMVVYQKKGMGVLVNFPDKIKLENVLKE